MASYSEGSDTQFQLAPKSSLDILFLIEGFGIYNVVGKRSAKPARSRTMKSNQRIVLQPENIELRNIATQIGICYFLSADTDTRGGPPTKGGGRVTAKMLQVAIADEHIQCLTEIMLYVPHILPEFRSNSS
jgi:hypothetical protein